MQLSQSGGYPQTFGPPGEPNVSMDIGSDAAMLDSFTDTLDPALTSGYSGDISSERRRQDASISTTLAAPRPIVLTSDESTLLAETERSDTTLHGEEQDYESGKKWAMEASERTEQRERAWALYDKQYELYTKNSKLSEDYAKLSRKHSGLSDQHFELSGKYFTLASGLP